MSMNIRNPKAGLTRAQAAKLSEKFIEIGKAINARTAIADAQWERYESQLASIIDYEERSEPVPFQPKARTDEEVRQVQAERAEELDSMLEQRRGLTGGGSVKK